MSQPEFLILGDSNVKRFYTKSFQIERKRGERRTLSKAEKKYFAKVEIDFAKRKRGELRDYLKQNLNIKSIPFIDIEIDLGEKNRQKIDELLREK